MNIKSKYGYSIIEVIAALTISVIIMTSIAWNFSGLKDVANSHLAINRASMIGTAKEAFVHEKGILGVREYRNAPNDEDRYNLIKQYLPYTNAHTTLRDYTPEGFTLLMNPLGTKTGILQNKNSVAIKY